MGRNLVETLMGAVVLVVAGLFLLFAYSTTRVQVTRGYEVTAKFERIDGLRVGSDVRLSGIRVGSVIDARLEPTTYLAVIRLSLDSSVRLPNDSVAEVASDGLLGGNFVALVPGGDDQIIPPNGEIRQTQSPVNLVHLLGRIIFSATENENARGQAQRAQPPATPR
jgi:phospholipid/cholesterol/gamma-HCH transport system substrate-binding protein